MRKRSTAIAVSLGLLAAIAYCARNRPADPPTYRASGPEPQILAGLPANPANLYYLTKPPFWIVPIKPFRPDDREFPKRHRYRDPQGPLAEVYNPSTVSMYSFNNQ